MQGDFPPNVVELIQRQLSQFGRVGATKIYIFPALAAPVPIAGSGNNISAPTNIRFREPGTVIALYGQELTGTVAKFAQTAVRIQVGGQEDLITDGQAGQFAPMLGLFGPNLNWFPLWRRAIPGVDWTVTYRNDDTIATASPTTMLAFIADADLARMSPAAS
jgi:hypothetical protein